jgi:hypothetical protein
MSADHALSEQQLRDFHAVIYALALETRSKYKVPRVQEDHILPLFCRMVDVFEPTRSALPHLNEKALGVDEINLACVESLTVYDSMKSAWGWGDLAIPNPDRAILIKHRRARYRELVEKPLLDIARSWNSGRLRFDHVRILAERAEALGVIPTLEPKDAEAKYEKAYA